MIRKRLQKFSHLRVLVDKHKRIWNISVPEVNHAQSYPRSALGLYYSQNAPHLQAYRRAALHPARENKKGRSAINTVSYKQCLWHCRWHCRRAANDQPCGHVVLVRLAKKGEPRSVGWPHKLMCELAKTGLYNKITMVLPVESLARVAKAVRCLAREQIGVREVPQPEKKRAAQPACLQYAQKSPDSPVRLSALCSLLCIFSRAAVDAQGRRGRIANSPIHVPHSLAP